MKKTFNMFLVAVMAAFFAVSCTSTADRAHTLKVYNWADYVDESLIEEFEQWYEEQTGEQVKVIYETFDINENMLTKIEVGKEDYDVVCPSEYIIQRMLRNNLLQPIQRTYAETNTPDWTTGVAPFVAEKFQEMSPVGSDLRVSDYAVGYMGGTTGWLYNPKYVQAEDLQSWDAILNPKFEDKIYMKDAFRDVYSVLVLYAYRDSIEAGTLTRAELVRDITPERIAAVEAVLKQAKSNIAAWEVDFGKEDMVKGKAWINLSWSGDAQWAIDEAAESGVELDYIVPQEGSNVWYDGWVIPIYAKNVRAASYWIDFMCKPENAIRNMNEIGYVSVIGTPEVMEAMIDTAFEPVDASYFFGNAQGADSVNLNPVMYPDRAVIERCALMHDCADQTEAMLDMWNRVKGNHLDEMGVSSYIIFGGVAILLVVFVVLLIAN